MTDFILFLVVFLAGMGCGHYVSPWLDEKLTPVGDDE